SRHREKRAETQAQPGERDVARQYAAGAIRSEKTFSRSSGQSDAQCRMGRSYNRRPNQPDRRIRSGAGMDAGQREAGGHLRAFNLYRRAGTMGTETRTSDFATRY